MDTVLKISPRLQTIVKLCDHNKLIADIGTDHGYVACELVLQEKAENVIAIDISEKCVSKAIWLANSLNISNFISFRVSDGFQNITKYDKVKQAVIAGMGGMEIIRILESKPKKLYDFVLQPMHDTLALRDYLIRNKYKILVDMLVFDNGKYYDVLKVTSGKTKLSDLEFYFGTSNFFENYLTFYNYLKAEKAKLDGFRRQLGDELSQNLIQHENAVNAAMSFLEQRHPDILNKK